MTNPYAPPQAAVLDIADPRLSTPHADRGTRLGAAILDGLIFAGMVYLPLIIAMAAMRRDAGEGQGAALVLIGGSLTLVGFIVWCWLTIRYVVRNGQSIGKKITSIKVIRSDGTPVSLGRIFWLRNVVNGLLSMIPLYSVIDIVFIFAESRQCLHDKIADTIVVKA